jgi:hypothetical protein
MEVQNDEIPLKELIEKKERNGFLFAFAMEGCCFGRIVGAGLGQPILLVNQYTRPVCLALEDEKGGDDTRSALVSLRIRLVSDRW